MDIVLCRSTAVVHSLVRPGTFMDTGIDPGARCDDAVWYVRLPSWETRVEDGKVEIDVVF